MQVPNVPASQSDRQQFVRWFLFLLDLLVAAVCLVALGSLVRWRLTATTDEFKIEWFLLVSMPFLTSLSALFALAAIGHWRADSWRWPAQWIAFAIGILMLGAGVYLLLGL